ncbi:MAG TPA: sigma-70 family RNA polymerase sigma factor [Acidobacteriota bacterium]|nr:sigma-70 family RNA polymerase sigma factor [Acidobacteriota bacterium]
MNPRSATVDPADLRSWIQRARKGDIGSYQRIYDSFARKVLNFIYHMVHSPEEAEDLTQETFVVVYQKLKTLNEIDKFEPWLFRIARNFVYQRYRKRAPIAASIDAPNEEGRYMPELVDVRKSPDEAFLAEELEEVVSDVIANLPEKYREVFVLSALQHLSYEEIADAVGRSIPSVKTDIHRARLEVRENVKKYLKV